MKHLKTFLIAVMMIVMAISFAACGTSNSPDTDDNGGIVIGGGENNGSEVETPDTPSGGNGSETPDTPSGGENTGENTPDERGEKVLVVYFSATNTTEKIAGYVSVALGNADMYEIEPAVPYTNADLNYNDSSSRSSIEMNDPNARPAIAEMSRVENMSQYDTIFIGYPIWWAQAPKIVITFLESYDFSGKTIIPFCTSASSGIGSSATTLARYTTGANWLSGQRFSGSASQATVTAWVNGLND